MWRHNRRKVRDIFDTEPDAHVGIATNHIDKEGVYKGGIGIKNIGKEATELSPELNGIGRSTEAHIIMNTTKCVAIDKPCTTEFMGYKVNRYQPDVGKRIEEVNQQDDDVATLSLVRNLALDKGGFLAH